MLAREVECLAEIGGAGCATVEQHLRLRITEVGCAAAEDFLRILIERDHVQLCLTERARELTHRADVMFVAERARRTRVDEQRDRLEWIVCSLATDRDLRGNEAIRGHRGGRAGDGRHEVAIGLPVPLGEVLLAALAIGRCRRERDFDAFDLRQATQRQDVLRAGQLLAVTDHDVLVAAWRDWKYLRGELIARRLLEQRRILFLMQEVVIRAARELLLDDFGLHPLPVVLHREARHRCALRQRDLKRALADAILGIVEVKVQLGERERTFEHRLRVNAREDQTAAVGRRQRPRRLELLVALRHCRE
jgi:hypothetical protein